MNSGLLKTRHSLRYSVISRLFALIIMLLAVLGGYQFNQIDEQATKNSESDKRLAISYFSRVLIQAIWEFDEPLIDELVAAQSNIESLVAISVPGLSVSSSPLFVRNDENFFVRSTHFETPETEHKPLNLTISYGEQDIGIITLYFDDDFYQKSKRDENVWLLIQIFILALILLVVFYFFINRYVVTPISNLYQSIEELSLGEEPKFDIQKDLPDNEIRLLAQKYSDVYYQLISHKDHLEDLVTTRTLGLEEANEKMKVEITNRIASEEAMELAKEEAQTANKTKTKFLSHITHELRTPLNGILGYAQILAERNLPKNERELTDHILRCSNHLLELINNILDYNKIESSQIELNLTPISLKNLIQEIKTIVYPHCDSKHLLLRIDFTDELPDSILLDGGKLKQVLINLLANAIKFTDRGGVRLSVEKKEAESYMFSVEDTGQGIPKEDYASIFDAYQQSKNTDTNDASTGLGLSISKSFIESMGGELKLESQVGKGSRFYFSLNLQSVNINSAIQTKGKIVKLKGSENLSILIVDDNRDNLFILRKVLQGVGFNVIEALSAKIAFDAIKQKIPDLIFMDVQMPEMDGTQAARLIRQEHTELAIIAFTANLYDESGASLKSDCFDDYIYKPVNRQVIYQILLHHLGLTAVYE